MRLSWRFLVGVRRELSRTAHSRRARYTSDMSGPSTKSKERPLVPHPDDEADVRAGLDEAERGDVLSSEESEEYIRSLIGDDAPEK